MNLSTNAFRPWINGNKQEDVFVGDPTGKPFIVRASKGGWLPINILIYAQDSQDAYERVKKGLRKTKDLQYPSEHIGNRYESLYELICNGEIEVEEFDKKYACRINWDSRGL